MIARGPRRASCRIPAYIYDGVTVDELTAHQQDHRPAHPCRRKGMGHNLNTRAAAMRYAREQGKELRATSPSSWPTWGAASPSTSTTTGRIEDFITDEEGPFSPERTGGLPMFDVIADVLRGGE